MHKSVDVKAVNFNEVNRKSIDKIRLSRTEGDPINKILDLFKQMEKASKDIPNALINHAVDKIEDVADLKT